MMNVTAKHVNYSRRPYVVQNTKNLAATGAWRFVSFATGCCRISDNARVNQIRQSHVPEVLLNLV